MSLATVPARSRVAAADRADAWCFRVEGSLEAHAPALAPRERDAARARRDGAAWACARATLRRLLGAHLGIPAAEVRFVAAPNGKPALAPGSGGDLRFSLSRSGGRVLVALRAAHDVGADLEQVRDGVDHAAVAALVLAPGERRRLASVPAPLRREAFFAAWTRHEALAKLGGEGLTGVARRRADAGVRMLPAPAGFAAAVASAGPPWRAVWHDGEAAQAFARPVTR